MRNLYFVSDGPLNVEELLYALSGYKNRQLVLFVQSLVQREKTDEADETNEAGKTVPFETTYVGRMGLRVKKLLPLKSNDNLCQMIAGEVLAGEMTAIRLLAEIEDVEFAFGSVESEDASPVLQSGLQVEIWYDYAGGLGLIWRIDGQVEDDNSGSRQRWSYLSPWWLCAEAFLPEKEMFSGRERKTLEEYQARLRELELPEELIFDKVLMEMLRIGPY